LSVAVVVAAVAVEDSLTRPVVSTRATLSMVAVAVRVALFDAQLSPV
jgi:hypothetical protein